MQFRVKVTFMDDESREPLYIPLRYPKHDWLVHANSIGGIYVTIDKHNEVFFPIHRIRNIEFMPA